MKNINTIIEIASKDILIALKDVPRIDSRKLAVSLHRPHKALFELIKKYQSDLERFAKLPFQTEALIDSETGQRARFALLTEDQSYLLLSYSKNTERVRELKIKMMEAFSAARRLHEQHVKDYLPTYHALHDNIKFMGLSEKREKHLHMNTNKLVNKCVGIKAGERGTLTEVPKSFLVVAQAIAANAMRGACDHKEAYSRMKLKLETYGQLANGLAVSAPTPAPRLAS